MNLIKLSPWPEMSELPLIERGAWRGEVRWGGVTEMSPLMTGWPCRYLFHFYFGFKNAKNIYMHRKLHETKKKPIAGCLFFSLFLYVSSCLPQTLILLPLIGANYAGIKGRGWGRSVMQHLWVRKEKVVFKSHWSTWETDLIFIYILYIIKIFLIKCLYNE